MFKNAALGSCLNRSHSSHITSQPWLSCQGQRGENHRRQWGVSLTVRKTDMQGEGRKEGGLGRLSPPPSCGLAVVHLFQSDPREWRFLFGEDRNPVQAEMAQANVRQKTSYQSFLCQQFGVCVLLHLWAIRNKSRSLSWKAFCTIKHFR